MIPVEPVLAVDEIQGNVLPGFNQPHQTLLGISFDAGRVEAARRWLGAVAPSVSTLGDVHTVRRLRRTGVASAAATDLVWTNVSLDAKALALLAPAIDGIRDMGFRQGMGAESDLGDPQDPAHPGHPSRWVVGGTPANTPEILVVLAGQDADAVRSRVADVAETATVAGLRVGYEQEGHALDGEVEHFGFRDGISSPGARGRLSETPDDFLTPRTLDPSDDRAPRFGRPGQPLIWPGQFVFGYPRQREDDPVRPGPVSNGGYPWMDNGSFLVFRRLRQDVAAFRRFVVEEAAASGRDDLTAARLAALLVGRWPKGTALIRNPAGDDPDPMADRSTVNDFGYAGDRFGRTCPTFAHIRKVNPRDLATDQGGTDRTLTFAILRRGIPWGDPYPESPADQAGDDGQRGLLFLCYQTSIAGQFGVLNSAWMNRVNGPEGGSGHDLLVGQGPGPTRQRTATLRGTPAGSRGVPIVTLAEWVVPTGGGYYFAPSVSTLRQFAAGLEPGRTGA